MQIITSKDNEIIKNVKKLKDKKYRDINKRGVKKYGKDHFKEKTKCKQSAYSKFSKNI